MASRISLILVLLTLELLFAAAVGAAGDIQQHTDPQGTIHINNRGSTSKDKDIDKDKKQSDLPASPAGAIGPLQPPRVFPSHPPAPPAPTQEPDFGS